MEEIYPLYSMIELAGIAAGNLRNQKELSGFLFVPLSPPPRPLPSKRNGKERQGKARKRKEKETKKKRRNRTQRAGGGADISASKYLL
ncbi:hypothetical protein I7I50_07117 [Histoplasma capsulatum G186AR]|uniref:Uncharacterized protein n=1 Tax=Ajellomyces capsulatus TaxID=5037 RepID=A0A8H7Z000_AJECA|nr:hypothetical protein I7I52_09838 [Histoplasma capsulatum]QSS67904.1 hypothetical protein I7I50_07117 [Histoplasma capsulatum G186AR]